MTSKGPRSRIDHESRAKRQKALEAPKEPRRPKAHWDHVLEEMVWLSKDFESERKWKLSQAKKVAVRASKCLLDQATKGERKMKEEEQRLRKIALNISKDMRKFWIKIEKLVLYKHQLELEERKKKTLDKQLDFLLGQTERYSTMLAENLVDNNKSERLLNDSSIGQTSISRAENAKLQDGSGSEYADVDNDYAFQLEDEYEDDEHTIEEDEALITEEERREEIAALQEEVELPLEELLQRYISDAENKNAESSGDAVNSAFDRNFDNKDALFLSAGATSSKNHARELDVPVDMEESKGDIAGGELTIKNLQDKASLSLDFEDEMDDMEYTIAVDEEKDDETTLVEEEELAMGESNPVDEIMLLQSECDMPLEELLAKYRKDAHSIDDALEDPSECSSSSSEDLQLVTPDMSIDDEHSKRQKISVVEHHADIKGDKQLVSPDISVDCEPSQQHKVSVVDHPDIKGDIDDNLDEGKETDDIIADAAAAARSAQPTGNTFSTTKVRTKFPFLLKFPLREYQHIGLDWLVTMYERRLNGILADEMGLGKTIMTIALLAHLACEKGIWGPHLIVVPTSVMLNWETEFLKWCPAFKILTYFGSAKERKGKRQGWLKPGSFHICITTYRLVIQDSKVFKRKKWKYLILDEAHLIKNWKSQRWQTLLNFNSKRRILLTGTPLQNDLMELWSLMHFLMPHIFQSHQEFKDWFSNPITGMVEGQEKVNKDVVDRLHNVLRPFILRRLKRDVEKQLPTKYEHVIYCRLSRRQRNLYEDFIASSETQATLASGNFFGMISVIMQLRKVCNHPDIFEGRPIISSFDLPGIDIQLSSVACKALFTGLFSTADLRGLNAIFTHLEFIMNSWEADEVRKILAVPSSIRESYLGCGDKMQSNTRTFYQGRLHGTSILAEFQKALFEEKIKEVKERANAIAWWNSLRCQRKPIYGTNLRELVTIKHPVFDIDELKNNPLCYLDFSSKLADIVLSPVERFLKMRDIVEHFMFAIPAARAPPPSCWCSKSDSSVFMHPSFKEQCTDVFSPLLTPIRPAIVRRQVYFPDRCLIQFDCGKLQELAVLLRRLKSEGHRALIFTQMTKMLDILEAFINLYGYTYMRLDGSTQPEERQTLMQRFNTNPRYFLFILSTRSGGVGINLVGADTVIFYDSDWNPAMDQQAQDRCHRIGQTREVHIYRLISESTIEENILKKANQKRALDDLVIQSGSYNTEFFKKLDPMELFSTHRRSECSATIECSDDGVVVPSNDDVEAAIKQAEDEADYMALKKLEQEEEVENQEFAEEAIGKMEDEDIGNEDDGKVGDMVISEHSCFTSIPSKEQGLCHENDKHEDKILTLVEPEEEVDMLTDVKQMAAAAAASGQASSSFEIQLRPIHRYAMRFLDLWDPIVDKSEIENDVEVVEEEWELDRIQKFKEDMEAEIDEDEEPLRYERWDAELATEAYKHHVEALAQQQLLEELEYEAQERNTADDGSADTLRMEKMVERKPKAKKTKKKFKSLKKGSLASEKESTHDELEQEMDLDVNDYNAYAAEDIYLDSPLHSTTDKKKRKLSEEEKVSKKLPKKVKKTHESTVAIELESSDKHHAETNSYRYVEGTIDYDKSASRSKAGGKLSITVMPMKRVMVIKREKLKKGSVWSKDCVPTPDVWTSQEDAILCAVVHEYGTNWSLVSDVLYGMTAGGFYRGRFRHPVHCCDRFRELFFRYILSTPDAPNIDKISPYTSGKNLLKATEEHVHTLLNVASELPDTELLLQKHFTAVLSSVWRCSCYSDRFASVPSSRSGVFSGSVVSPKNLSGKFTDGIRGKILRQCSRIVARVLADAETHAVHEDEGQTSPTQSDVLPGVDKMEISLEFPKELVESLLPFPPVITLPVSSFDTSQPATTRHEMQDSSSKIYRYTAEQHFRLGWEVCLEGEKPDWVSASTGFPVWSSGRSRFASKTQVSGKHKCSSESSKGPKTKIPRNTEIDDSFLIHKESSLFTGSIFSDSVNLDSPVFPVDASEHLDCYSSQDTDVSDLSMTNLLDEDPGFRADLVLDPVLFDLESLDNFT